jgi:hypothetical protein
MTQKFSAARKQAFLTCLSQTGNQTLSAERAKVSRSWVSLPQSTNAEFDVACREAIAAARERLQSPLTPARSLEGRGSNGARSKWRGYFHGHELVVRGTGGAVWGRRVQIGRARLKQWTPRVEQRFLVALAATCNVRHRHRQAEIRYSNGSDLRPSTSALSASKRYHSARER